MSAGDLGKLGNLIVSAAAAATCCLIVLVVVVLWPTPPPMVCTNVCHLQHPVSHFAGNGVCDDGWQNATTSYCQLGHDCADCGAREEVAIAREVADEVAPMGFWESIASFLYSVFSVSVWVIVGGLVGFGATAASGAQGMGAAGGLMLFGGGFAYISGYVAAHLQGLAVLERVGAMLGVNALLFFGSVLWVSGQMPRCNRCPFRIVARGSGPRATYYLL